MSPLLTDLYQLNMLQAYLGRGATETAVFEFFVRKLPARRGFLMAAGLESVLHFLETGQFSPEEIDWLGSTKRFSRELLDYLRDFRFTGDVQAMREGTVFFADEPVLRITAPLPQAQLIETRVVNLLHFQCAIISKAARMVLAAPGKLLLDFGARYAHGAEAAMQAARASYIAGFAGTATVLAGKEFGIPIFGTMAHSFILTHHDESAAFEDFARERPDSVILLIDTYDTDAGARKVVALAPKLKAAGIKIRGVRIDSGDLVACARSVRSILDAGGLQDAAIFVSGGIDEDVLADFIKRGAPIDGYGIGTSLTTSIDAPALDGTYKLQEYAGSARRKRSPGKETWPGRKQVWRRYADGRMAGDVLSVEDDRQDGTSLLEPVMRGGKRLAPAPTLDALRAYAAKELASLPEPLRRLEPMAYPIEVAAQLLELARDVDERRPRS
ncbi:MAG TPA: nicotinate phosphoribosyltransferase [Pseudolabrys sp.]|nr:nicotinate phosphoribosyltransferase [Pseudolabrys sp.]